MATMDSNLAEEDICIVLDMNGFDTDGLGLRLPARIHKSHREIDEATIKLRRDWAKQVGTITEFGQYNPFHGNFIALALPTCLPERVSVLARLSEGTLLFLGQDMQLRYETMLIW